MFELRRSHPSLLFINSLGRHRPWSTRLQIPLLIAKVLPPISVINFLDIVVTIMVREYKAKRFTAPSASLFTVNDLRQRLILLLMLVRVLLYLNMTCTVRGIISSRVLYLLTSFLSRAAENTAAAATRKDKNNKDKSKQRPLSDRLVEHEIVQKLSAVETFR